VFFYESKASKAAFFELEFLPSKMIEMSTKANNIGLTISAQKFLYKLMLTMGNRYFG
jgi:ADP-dependent phosphofructokinase/glucokinase